MLPLFPLITDPSLLMPPGLSPSTFQSLRLCPLPPCQDASSFFSLVGQNNPALRLEKTLDFYKIQSMTLKLLARVSRPQYLSPGYSGPVQDIVGLTCQSWLLLQDTLEEDKNPSHTATATLVLNVLPADLRTPWFLPCSFSDGYSCIQAQYHGVVPIGYTLVMGSKKALGLT